MTVGDLREKIKDLDDRAEVVVMGHFGEAVRLGEGSFWVCRGPNRLVGYGWEKGGEVTKDDVFVIPIANIGPEPD